MVIFIFTICELVSLFPVILYKTRVLILGASRDMVKMMTHPNSKIEVTRNGDHFDIKYLSPVKNMEIEFNLGMDFDEDLPMGHGKVKEF